MTTRPKILVRTTNWIGDVVMNLPAIEVLRRHFPEAEIVAACRPWAGALLEFRPDLIDRWVPVNDASGVRPILQVAKQLRKEGFSHGFTFPNHFKGALLLWLSRVPVRGGFFRAETRLFLNRGLKRKTLPRSGRHQSRDYLDLLTACGFDAGEPAEPRLHRDPERAAAAVARHLGDVPKPWLMVHAGAAFGTAKRWLPDRYAEVCRRFSEERGGTVVLLGVASEAEVNDEIAAVTPGCVNLCGKTSLAESLALIGEADAFLSNDSGLMHVAAAFGIPQVAIFGPTDVRATFPANPKAEILHEPVECSPCFQRHCPIGHDCMKAIAANAVEQRLNAVLDNAS